MSTKERTGKRDPSYPEWHRVESIRRYVPYHTARKLCTRDCDYGIWLDYTYGVVDGRDMELPSTFIETARDTPYNREHKLKDRGIASWRKAAEWSLIPFMVVLYKCNDQHVPGSDDPDAYDIEEFRVAIPVEPDILNMPLRKAIDGAPCDGCWRVLTPRDYAKLLELAQTNAKRLYHHRKPGGPDPRPRSEWLHVGEELSQEAPTLFDDTQEDESS